MCRLYHLTSVLDSVVGYCIDFIINFIIKSMLIVTVPIGTIPPIIPTTSPGRRRAAWSITDAGTRVAAWVYMVTAGVYLRRVTRSPPNVGRDEYTRPTCIHVLTCVSADQLSCPRWPPSDRTRTAASDGRSKCRAAVTRSASGGRPRTRLTVGRKRLPWEHRLTTKVSNDDIGVGIFLNFFAAQFGIDEHHKNTRNPNSVPINGIQLIE